MRAVDLIRKKRDGGRLSSDELGWLVRGIGGEIADYQWSALLMAIVWRGMDAEETAALTDAMLHSGTVVDLSAIPGLKVDKHSTGGVGDKTSLILAPIAAAAGVPVPMVSGRGLGHTGGTLDKLESIPGFSVRADLNRYIEILGECGLVMIGQTDEIAPADRVLYALRDASGSVESLPLIAASIMSKKLAEGIDGLVLDVKFGDGALLPPLDEARTLASTMVSIGQALGKRMRALLTRMDQPLGFAVGNANEVAECLDCLRGEGPDDLRDLSIELAAEMIVMGERAATLEDARRLALGTIADGSALEKFRALIAAQGGDPSVVDDPRRLPQPVHLIEVPSPDSGFVRSLKARTIGHATMALGAGRTHVDSKIDPAVGVRLRKKIGDRVELGETLFTVELGATSPDPGHSIVRILSAYEITNEPPEIEPIILERI